MKTEDDNRIVFDVPQLLYGIEIKAADPRGQAPCRLHCLHIS